MTSDGFHDFFLASAGVAGALIGLLFVAISVAAERLNAENANQAHRVRASTALSLFTNALGVSLFALIPGIDVGSTASIVAGLGLVGVAGSLLSLVDVRSTQPAALRDAGYLIGLIVILVLQLTFGLELAHDAQRTGTLRGICILVIVCFLAGIARSWELIGGPQLGLLSRLRTRR